MKYSLTISLLLFIIYLYFSLVSLRAINVFNDHQDLILFLLYTIPLLMMMLLVQLFEGARQRLTGKWCLSNFLILFSLVGLLVPLLGLLLAPISIRLFSFDNLWLLSIGFGCGFFSALGNYLIFFRIPSPRKPRDE